MKRFAPYLSVVLVLLLCSAALACPMCKDSIPNSDAKQPGSLPSGFNFSIYYMLVGLFLMMGFVGTVIVKGIRSANAAHSSQLRPPQS